MGGNADPAYDQWIASLPTDDPIRKVPVFKVQPRGVAVIANLWLPEKRLAPSPEW